MVSGGLPKATLRERLEARSESPRRATRRNDRGHEQAIECSRSRDTGGASRASGEGDPEGAFPGRAARARQKRRTAVPEQKPSGRRAPCGPGAPRREARHPVGGAAGPTPRDSSESAPISLTGTEPPSSGSLPPPFFSNSPALRAATDEQVRRFRTVVEGALLNKLGKVA